MARFGVAALLALLVGCQQIPEPQSFRHQGPYRHAYTQLLFPERLGHFERAYVTTYDPSGANVSGHYEGPRALPSTATVYHYPATQTASPPAPGEVRQHYEEAKAGILLSNEGARLVSEDVFDTEMNGLAMQGLHAVYDLPSFPAYEGPAESHLYLFVLDGWYLKFRFSHPEAVAETASRYEREFVSGLTWPLPEAAAH